MLYVTYFEKVTYLKPNQYKVLQCLYTASFWLPISY